MTAIDIIAAIFIFLDFLWEILAKDAFRKIIVFANNKDTEAARWLTLE